VLYDAGDEKTAVTGGWEFVQSNATETVGRTTGVKESNRLVLTSTPTNTLAALGSFATINSLSLANCSTLRVIVSTNGFIDNTTDNDDSANVSITTNRNINNSGYPEMIALKTVYATGTQLTNYTIDLPIYSISAGYVGIIQWASSGNTGGRGTTPFTLYIHKVSLFR